MKSEIRKKKTVLFLILFGFFFSLSEKQIFGSFEKKIKVEILSKYSLKKVEIEHPGFLIKFFRDGKWEETKISSSNLYLSISGKQIEIRSDTLLVLVDRLVIDFSSPQLFKVKISSGESKSFKGTLFVRVSNRKFIFIQQLELENYVRGVLAEEMPLHFPIEALKSQAVLIRTYTFSHLGRHKKEGFDFCDLTHCQVYGVEHSLSQEKSFVDEIVRQTEGMILTYLGSPVQALYHSTCGGHTSASYKVFTGKPISYLRGVEDPYCKNSPHAEWEGEISLSQLKDSFSKISSDNPDSFQELIVEEQEQNRSKAGRVFQVAWIGRNRTIQSTMDFLSLIGKRFGWNLFKSNWFTLEKKGGELLIHGKGLGHGVGLCQWGAKGMAESGKKFDEILQYYFPGTRVVRRK